MERLRMLTLRGRMENLAAGKITDTNEAIKELAGTLVELMATPHEDAVEHYQAAGGQSARAQFDAKVGDALAGSTTEQRNRAEIDRLKVSEEEAEKQRQAEAELVAAGEQERRQQEQAGRAGE